MAGVKRCKTSPDLAENHPARDLVMDPVGLPPNAVADAPMVLEPIYEQGSTGRSVRKEQQSIIRMATF